jgi:hypothetical protein
VNRSRTQPRGPVPPKTSRPEHKPWAIFSPCGRYRYVLAWPTGAVNAAGHHDERYALFVLANPSTATAEQTDPTVARCIAYAKRWGYGWCRVVNVRAWRETDPRKLPADPLAISEPDEPALNDNTIQAHAMFAAIVVVGWGKLGGERGPQVLGYLRAAGVTPHALKLNKDGGPAHPLYLRADAQPFPMKRRT